MDFHFSANGFARGEATVAVFLQKRRHARRIYANLIHSKTNSDGFKLGGIMSPSAQLQKELFVNFYKEININPSLLSYLEAHGTATQVICLIKVNQ